MDAIENVEFAGGDIHRQIITWESGAKVYVNRGESDWLVAGRCLPQYGCFAANGSIESSIEKINGIIVEQSRAPSRFYVNARASGPVDFGPVLTDGALRCQTKDDAIVITPLPDTAPFAVKLSPDRLPVPHSRDRELQSVVAVDADGKSIRDVDFTVKGNLVEFQTRENEFAYILQKDKK
jgi:hypothetical protein